jgi:hypothetical protein
MIRLIDAATEPNCIKGIRPYQRLEGFRMVNTLGSASPSYVRLTSRFPFVRSR